MGAGFLGAGDKPQAETRCTRWLDSDTQRTKCCAPGGTFVLILRFREGQSSEVGLDRHVLGKAGSKMTAVPWLLRVLSGDAGAQES
jgi:hypothetical protein